MGSLLQLSLLVALAAVIAVDANVLSFEQNFVPTDPDVPGSRGNKFYVAFMQNVDRDTARMQPELFILVTTNEPESVEFTVTTFLNGFDTSNTYTATHGTTTRVAFSADDFYVNDQMQRDRAIRVQAEEGKKISVYAVNDEFRSTDGFLALSCDGMKVENDFRRYDYVILSAELTGTVDNPQTNSEFLIIPCEDNTRIDITPTQLVTVDATDFSTPQFGPGSVSFAQWRINVDNVRPSAGDTLLIEHPNDLTGTRIRGTKPLVVFSGHQCAQVPTGVSACDHLVEQIPPHTTWGYTFLLNPLAFRESGDYFRVATVHDNTKVTITCVDEGGSTTMTLPDLSLSSAVTPVGSNFASFQTQVANKPPCPAFVRKFCCLQATNPVIVAQYSQGHSVDTACTAGTDIGDPFMSLIPPVIQYLNNYTISSITAEAGSFPLRYVSVSVYKTFFDPSRIMIDGKPVESDRSAWQGIYCSDGGICGYGIYKNLTSGDHIVYHEDPNAGLSVQTYGFQSENSYGILAGMELEQISGTVIQCAGPDRCLESETFTLICTRSLDTALQSRIAIMSEDGTAMAPVDYDEVDIPLIIYSPGQTDKETPIKINADSGDSAKVFYLNVIPVRTAIVLTPRIEVEICGRDVTTGPPVVCPDLVDPVNGMVMVTGNSVGNTATYSCDDGFSLSGVVMVTCQGDGEWSDPPPICVPVPPVVQFSPITYTVTEGLDEFAILQLIRSGVLTGSSVVTVTTLQGTASDVSDFVSVTMTVTFLSGETTASVSVSIVDDSNIEDTEMFSATLTAVSNVVIGSADTATITILDDDLCPDLPNPANGMVTISGNSDGETATYTCDQGYELVGAETLTCLSIGAQWSDSPPECQLIEVTINLEVPDSEVVESDGTVSVRVTLSAPFPDDIDFVIRTVDDSANGGVDFGMEDVSGSIPAGQTEALVFVPIVNDNELEQIRENFAVVLEVPTRDGLRIGTSTAMVTILDDDLVIGFEETMFIVDESAGLVNVNVAVLAGIEVLTEGIISNVVVRLYSQDGTAIAPGDYTSIDTMLTFDSDNIQITVPVGIVDDDIHEDPDEFFLLHLELINGINVTVSPDEAMIQIVDNECPVLPDPLNGMVTVTGLSARDVATYSCNVGFQLVGNSQRTCQTVGEWSLEPPICIPLCPDLVDPANGKVMVGGNSDGDNATYSCDPGYELEGTEIVICQSDGQWSDLPPVCLIIVVTVSFQPVEYMVSEVMGSVVLRLIKIGAIDIPVTVTVSTMDGTAAGGLDYDSITTEVTFQPGVVEMTVSVPITDDGELEGAEVFMATLTTISNHVVLGDSLATITILDITMCPPLMDPENGMVNMTGQDVGDTALYSCNDGFLLVGSMTRDCQSDGMWSTDPPICLQVTINLEAPDSEVVESDGAVFLRVTLSAPFPEDIDFLLSSVDGSANGGVDFGMEDVSGSIPAGQTEAVVSLPIVNDNEPEQFRETFRVFLRGVIRDGLITGTGVVRVTIFDDDLVIGFEETMFIVDESAGLVDVNVSVLAGIEVLTEGIISNVDIRLYSQDGTAVAPGDYTSIDMVLTFDGGNIQITVPVEIVEDNNPEDTEEFSLHLELVNGINVTVSPDEATFQILDNECPVLPHPLNGEVTFTGFSVGNSAFYSCDNGFELVGNSPRTCQSNNMWSGEEPMCRPLCPDLVDPVNGTVMMTGNSVGDTATYSCDDGFTLSGVDMVTCQDDGEWSDPPPICVAFPVVEFSPISYTVTEGLDAFVVLQLIRSGRLTGSSVVTVTTLQDTASDGSDFEPVSETVTFLPGETTAPVSVSIVDDSNIEDTEMFSATLTTMDSNVVIGSDDTATVTILDDDQCPVLDDPANGMVTWTSLTTGGVATYECDPGFELVGVEMRDCQSNSLWSGEAPICRPLCPDLVDPVNGMVMMTGNSVGDTSTYSCDDGFALSGVVMVTCQDDGQWSDPPPICVANPLVSFDPTSYTVIEGVDEYVLLGLVRSGDISGSTTVAVETLPGTAMAGSDFMTVTMTVIFGPGETTADVNITIVDDNIMEGTEMFSATLTTADPNVMIGDGTATVTILDDDVPVPMFEMTMYTVPENLGSSVPLCVDIGVEITENLIYTINAEQKDPPEAQDADFKPSKTITIFPPGSSGCTDFSELVCDDNIALEGDQRFTITIGNSLAWVTITDNDLPIIQTQDVEVNEDEGIAELPVIIVNPIESNFTLDYSTGQVPNGADENTDFSKTTGSIVFTPEQTQRSIFIPITDDQDPESNEPLTVTLTSPDLPPDTLPPVVPQIIIIDNDMVIGFDPTTYEVTEGEDDFVRMSLFRTGNTELSGSVTLMTIPDSAEEGTDYVPTDTIVTFGPGETVKPVDIPIINDDVTEPTETFFAILNSTASNVIVPADSGQAVITIVDIDEAVIGFDETFYDVDENAGQVVVTVRLLSGGLSSDVIVHLETQDRSAEDPDDYIGVLLLLLFSPTINQSEVSILITDDSVHEPNAENFVARLALVTTNVNVQVSPDSATIQIIDDDTPMPQFEQSMYTVPENDRTVPLCIDIGVQITESLTYTITAVQKSPPEAEDSDFGASASITVNPPGPMACIDFTDLVVNDNVALEGLEAFTILVGNSMSMVTIIDDDLPVISTPDQTVNENAGPAVVCVELENPIEMPFQLDFMTGSSAPNGIPAATAGVDYVLSNGTVVFQPGGVTDDCINIDIIDDGDPEPNEVFEVTYTHVDIAEPPSIATVTIIDNDLRVGIVVNDSVISDPQFTVTLPMNRSRHMCYEVHGVAGQFFNLISDTCTSVNALFAAMPGNPRINRMSRIGIHAVTTATASGNCADIQIDIEDCVATLNGAPINGSATIDDIRVRKFGNRWRVSVPNCDRPSAVMWITCQSNPQMLRFDIARGSNLRPTSHGLLGQFWNIPIAVTEGDDGPYIEIYSPGADNYRRIPALEYSLTWDHSHKLCYYVGNSQGGPERSHNPVESVIQGYQPRYQTAGLFETSFEYEMFDEGVC